MEPGFMPLSIYCVQMAPKWSCVLDSQPIQGKDMSVQVYYDQFCTWRSKLEAVNYIGDEESYIDEFLYGLKMDLVVRMWAHERKPCSLYDAFSRALIEESSLSWTELSRNHNADKVFDEMPHPKSVCRAAVQAVPDAKSNGVRQLLDSEEETAIEIISEQNDSENDEEGDFLHLKADNPLVEMVGQFFPSKPEIVEDAHHMFDEMLRPVSVSRNSDASFFRVEGNDYLSSKLKGLQFGWQLFDVMPKRISAELNKEMYAIQDYTSPFGYFQQIFDTGSSFLNYDGVILSFDPGGCSLSQMGSSSSLLRAWDWTDFFYPNWGDNFGLTARIIFSVFEHLVSIGVIGVDAQSYVWKPGQYMIPYILEDKDVVKRNGIGVRLALTQDEEPNGILKIDLRYKEVFYIPAIVVVKKNAQHEGESIVKAKKDEHSEVKKLKNMEIIPPMVSQVIETPTLYDPFTYLYVQINRRSFPTKFELYLGDLYLHNGISLANGCRKDDIVFLCDTDLYAYFNWMELAGVLLFDTSEVDGSEVDKMNEWQQKCGGQFMTKMEGMVTPISSKWCGISNFHVHCFMNEFLKLLCRCYLPMEDKGHYSITILQLIARSAVSMDIIQVWEVCWTSLPGLKFPEIAKPLVADGSAKPHKMLLAFNNEGLNKLKPPTVLHEFVNEGGVIFKVYVVDDCVKYVKRKSLPDVDEESSGNLEGCLTFLQVSNLNAFENNFEGYFKLVRLEDIEYSLMALVTDIARGLKEATKLNLFYFDVIRYTSYGNRYLVIDINYFPGYAKMPNYETILTDFVWDVLSKRYQCSGKVEKMANCEDEKRLLLVENTKILEDENGGFVSDLEREEQLLRSLREF